MYETDPSEICERILSAEDSQTTIPMVTQLESAEAARVVELWKQKLGASGSDLEEQKALSHVAL
jgi:hypothetical protein